MSNILIIEPFYGGSHKQLIDLLRNNLSELKESILYTMPAKKWHWRARVSALQISQQISFKHNFDVLFCSSVLNLSELCGLRPDLAQIKRKIIYFHENQLVYPVQVQKERDIQYGYNQITSAIVADIVLFNSEYNMRSFLNSIQTFLSVFPDFKMKGLKELIIHKCSVLYFPIEKPLIVRASSNDRDICHIIWPHRWEHDKNPTLFFSVLKDLKDADVPFRVSVLGEAFSEVALIFDDSRILFEENIVNWGFLASKELYYNVLNDGDVVVSTADHEFFGVAMIEAAMCGCVPICPRRLSYPEVFKDMNEANKAYFYNTRVQLFKILKSFCLKIVRGHKTKDAISHLDLLKTFSWDESLRDDYQKLFSL